MLIIYLFLVLKHVKEQRWNYENSTFVKKKLLSNSVNAVNADLPEQLSFRIDRSSFKKE